MSPSTILQRVRGLIASAPNEHFLLKGTPKNPVSPMSDQELAQAIREFGDQPVTNRTVAKLSPCLAEVELNG